MRTPGARAFDIVNSLKAGLTMGSWTLLLSLLDNHDRGILRPIITQFRTIIVPTGCMLGNNLETKNN
jgi:hypothetical protein